LCVNGGIGLNLICIVEQLKQKQGAIAEDYGAIGNKKITLWSNCGAVKTSK